MAVGTDQRRSGPHLLERGEELAVFDRALEGLGRGEGAGVVIQGPAGVGKTRLLAEARAAAEARGFEVWSARGGVLEREYPFGVLRQLVARLPERRAASLVETAGPAAGVVLDPVRHPQLPSPDALFAVLNSVFWACAAMADERPLALCVDECQWADEGSLRFFDFAARRLDDLPLALLVAFRTGEGAAVSGAPGLAELRASPRVEVLSPAPLSVGGVCELTRDRFGGDHVEAFAAACHQWTGGNPLLLHELQKALVEQGVRADADGVDRVGELASAAVGDVVLARLARLEPAAVALARAVAILGEDAQLPDAARLAHLERAQAARAAAALARADIFGETKSLNFTHPVLRAVVYEDTSQVLRGEGHAQAARLLYQRGASTEKVAAHLLRAPPDGDQWASDQLRSAGADAASRGASPAAVVLLERALAEGLPTERADVLHELGRVEGALRYPAAVAHASSAFEMMPPGPVRAQVGLLLARLYRLQGRSQDSRLAVAAARDGLGPADRELSLLLDAVAIGGTITLDRGSPAQLTQLAYDLDELLGLAGATAGERTALAAVAYVRAKEVAPADEVVELLERAIRGGGCSFLDGPPGYFPFTLIAPLSWAGRIQRAVELENSLLEEARGAGSVLWHIETCAARAFSRWYGGSLREAEADARDALAASEAHGLPFFHYPLANGALVNSLTEQGLLDDALSEAEQFEFPSGRDDNQFSAVRDVAHARLEIALGRYDAALSRLTGIGETMTSSGTLVVEVCPWREMTAQALLALERRDEARSVLAPALDASRRFGGPLGLGTTLRTAALIERPASVDLLREAVAVLEPSEIRLEHARALVDLGATLRRLGYRQDARAPLAEGLEMAHGCGAAPLAGRARTELVAAGARPRRVERSGTDSLTASELRVAQLAAAGLSNREIAQQLFVTMRTISTHLTHTYTKLGIEGRDQLASALAG